MSITLPTVRQRDGFTIVELLIVIVVIGILAAITVVAYNGIQERANSAAIVSQAQAYVKGLKLWEADIGRPTVDTCITPSSYTTCTNAWGFQSNEPVNAAFMSNLTKYSGVSEMRLGKYGLGTPVGSMGFYPNYYGDNRDLLIYSVGPNINCGLPNVLSPTPGYDNLTLNGAVYTERDANSTRCMIEVFKY